MYRSRSPPRRFGLTPPTPPRSRRSPPPNSPYFFDFFEPQYVPEEYVPEEFEELYPIPLGFELSEPFEEDGLNMMEEEPMGFEDLGYDYGPVDDYVHYEDDDVYQMFAPLVMTTTPRSQRVPRAPGAPRIREYTENDRERNRQYYLANKERINTYNKEYEATQRQKRKRTQSEKDKERVRTYQKANKERVKAYNKQYYETHRDEINRKKRSSSRTKEKNRERYQRNKELVDSYEATRRM